MCVSHTAHQTLYSPIDCSPPDSSVHGILQARILGSHSLLQGIFPTQGLKPGLLHCRQILYHLSHQWKWKWKSLSSVQFLSVAQSCPALCDPMNWSTPDLPDHHQFPEFTQTHVHWVGDDIQPSHPLSAPSPHTINLSQHQGLLQWVSSSHEVAKVLQFQLQYQTLQWIFRTDFL